MFQPPMNARPLPKDFELEHGLWVAEEKYDGHRIIVEVAQGKSSLFVDREITAWSRYGNIRQLPTHILEEFSEFPDGIYDGELLVPGKRSYGVTELINTSDLVYYMFDVLQFGGGDISDTPYYARRAVLYGLIEGHRSKSQGIAIQLAESRDVDTWEELVAYRDEVWARGGEGLILKRKAAPYVTGKRSKDFLKIKKLQHTLLTVIGFLPSHGTINDRGPYAIVQLEDDESNVTTVKTRNDAMCRTLEEEAVEVTGPHPAIGRKLWIEYQERLPDGGYRHGRWDRWDNE